MARPPKTPLRNSPDLKDEGIDDLLEAMLGESKIDGRSASELGEDDVETWIKSRGWTPIEFLTHTYRNPWQKMNDRISAAKAVLEYVHRKLPQKLEIEGSMGTKNLSLDASALSKLSTEELDALTTLLEKIG